MAIHQVRNARRKMPLRIEHPAQKTAAYGGAKGKSPDLKVPKKAAPSFGDVKDTKPPKGRALPVRGEADAD